MTMCFGVCPLRLRRGTGAGGTPAAPTLPCFLRGVLQVSAETFRMTTRIEARVARVGPFASLRDDNVFGRVSTRIPVGGVTRAARLPPLHYNIASKWAGHNEIRIAEYDKLR